MTGAASNPTRDAIVSAFNRLVLARRQARPPIAHLLREAGVARSTLYKHFDDRDSLLLEAMGGPLSIIATAITASESNNALVTLLDHFWEQRRSAPDVFNGPFAARLVRALAERIVAETPELERSDAIRIADTQIAFIRLWLSGETPGPAPTLAAKMIASARAQRAALQGL